MDYKKLNSFQIDYAEKTARRRDWRGMACVVAVIAAFLGLVAIEIFIMGGEFGL